MAYDPTSTYDPYLTTPMSTSSCTDCDPCHKCPCCPPGLVEVTDELGNPAGCITPTDAAQYTQDKPCPTGYVRLFDKSDPPVFLGCVTPADAKSFNS